MAPPYLEIFINDFLEPISISLIQLNKIGGVGLSLNVSKTIGAIRIDLQINGSSSHLANLSQLFEVKAGLEHCDIGTKTYLNDSAAQLFYRCPSVMTGMVFVTKREYSLLPVNGSINGIYVYHLTEEMYQGVPDIPLNASAKMEEPEIVSSSCQNGLKGNETRTCDQNTGHLQPESPSNVEADVTQHSVTIIVLAVVVGIVAVFLMVFLILYCCFPELYQKLKSSAKHHFIHFAISLISLFRKQTSQQSEEPVTLGHNSMEEISGSGSPDVSTEDQLQIAGPEICVISVEDQPQIAGPESCVISVEDQPQIAGPESCVISVEDQPQIAGPKSCNVLEEQQSNIPFPNPCYDPVDQVQTSDSDFGNIPTFREKHQPIKEVPNIFKLNVSTVF